MTVTAVSCEPDLRHATVLLASLPDTVREALGEVRPRLQAAIAHQVRMKRTPQLSFQVDPAVDHGELVEEYSASCAPAGNCGRARLRAGAGGRGRRPGGRAGGPERGRRGARLRPEAPRARAPSRRCEPGRRSSRPGQAGRVHEPRRGGSMPAHIRAKKGRPCRDPGPRRHRSAAGRPGTGDQVAPVPLRACPSGTRARWSSEWPRRPWTLKVPRRGDGI